MISELEGFHGLAGSFPENRHFQTFPMEYSKTFLDYSISIAFQF